jgi:hypothetical protein
VVFFAPVERDLSKGFGTECKSGRFDAASPNGVLEHPECPSAVDGAQKIFTNFVGFNL